MATGLALCLAVVPLSPTRAASPSAHAEPLPAKADPIAEVRALYELGMAAFEAAEYDEALMLWKRAFVLPPYDRDQATRAVLVANIVAAHSRAHQLGHNPEHLAEAMRVIDLRKAELAQLYGPDEATVSETLSLDTQRAQLVRRHELALREGELARELAAGTALRIEPPPPPVLTREQVDAAVAADAEFGSNYRRAKSMADGSIPLLAVGGAFLFASMMVVVTYSPKDGPYDLGDTVPIVVPLASVAGVATIIGCTLAAVGSKRKQQARQGYRDRQSLTRMLVPMSLPRGGGLGFVGRF